MSKMIEVHQPCPNCKSSDAYCKYDDGHGWCFSCNTYTASEKSKSKDVYFDVPSNYRGIAKRIWQKYKVMFRLSDGELNQIIFPVGKDRFQHRSIADKNFWFSGSGKQTKLFGEELFERGGAKAITICEGYIDALSVYQMMGEYPVVAVTSASSAKTECARSIDFLNSFETIYICFDNDDPGERAAKEVASLFDYRKTKFVKMDRLKDPNEYLEAGKEKEFASAWWASKNYTPDNIVFDFKDIDALIDGEGEEPSVSFPFAKINEMTYGIRLGEVVLLTGQEGIGKTEVIRAIEYSILKETTDNIGIIHLEESKLRAIKGLVGLDLKQPVHLPDSLLTKEDIKAAYHKLSGEKERIFFYTDNRSEDMNDLLQSIRFMVTALDCKYVFLDHITLCVTGLEDVDERRFLDVLSTKLLKLTEELHFSLILVSHLNEENKTRGSKNISKIADTHIFLDRNPDDMDPIERNTTKLYLRKNRYGAATGPAGQLFFDAATFTLIEQEEKPFG